METDKQIEILDAIIIATENAQDPGEQHFTENVLEAPVLFNNEPIGCLALILRDLLNKKEVGSEFTERLRESFFHRLSAKTNWGRNQVKDLFNAAVEDAQENA